MTDIEASIVELRAQQAAATQAYQIQQSANEELLVALQAKLDSFAPGQPKAEQLKAREECRTGRCNHRRVNPAWCAQNGLGAMPPEGLKALFAVFLEALQEVQPAPEAPVQGPAQPSSVGTGPATRETTAPLVDASLKDGANEITMQQDDRGTIRGSRWSDDTKSDGLQEDNDP